jgi:hypothetical protein
VLQTKELSYIDVAKLIPLTKSADFDFWSRPRPGQNVEILVSPEKAISLWDLLVDLNLEPSLLVNDVSRQVHVTSLCSINKIN